MMTNDVGLVKSDSRLENAREKIAQIRADVVPVWHATKPTQAMVELRNLIICAELVIEASIAEGRTSDFTTISIAIIRRTRRSFDTFDHA